ncbi:MAG: hypothetical protein K5798_10295 [Nitrosopumilus sp.]|uniref:hypothetical protein n=1 Tax=Nitrosopumilus sp. TaxID=2024843 RepID=UPI002431262B|nr:hypothetical protein [Nitrosopumilus sp.]MCV0367634.1 hypothetical protein [Nitrosopumilus sp.]
MKTRLLIIIIVTIAISSAIFLSYYTISDSSPDVFISCTHKYEKIGDKCIQLKPEQYCKDWCDLEELSELGCTELAVDHVFLATNLFDENFGDVYYRNLVGLPSGLSEEEFDMCAEIIKEKHSLVLKNKIPLSTSDEDLKSKAYIANCDKTIHKEKLPDLIIENSTHNYDMQYCKWELKYPDLTLINNANLLNDYPYCAELFDTLFDYYRSISDPCGMQRYNEDGTPRAICEPLTAGAGVPYDINMIKSGCAFTHDKWAYLTEHNDDVFYLFDRTELDKKISGNLDEQIKIIDKLCEDNDYHSVKPNIKFRNNTHWIDTNNCALKLKNEN